MYDRTNGKERSALRYVARRYAPHVTLYQAGMISAKNHSATKPSDGQDFGLLDDG